MMTGKPTFLSTLVRSLLWVVCTIVFFDLLVIGLANASWSLAGAGKEDLNALRSREGESLLLHWKEARDEPVNEVVSWPADRPRVYREAPMLAERVRAGKLPPVSERLPEDPVVQRPCEQIGPYGGTWVTYASSPQQAGSMAYTTMNEYLLRWNTRGDAMDPNVAYLPEITDGGRSFIIRLRKGIKWSDGQPLTSDDIMFWYESVFKNPDLTPSVLPDFKQGEDSCVVTRLDDYRVKFTFPRPNGLFIQRLANIAGYEPLNYPKHYLSKYHPDYLDAKGEEALDAEAKAAGESTWNAYFKLNRADLNNPECPRLWAWTIESIAPLGVRLARNPYYAKVDSAGNQLPYLDYIDVQVFDSEAVDLKLLAGEFAFYKMRLRADKFPIWVRHQSRVDSATGKSKQVYRVQAWPSTLGTHYLLALNLNHKDPVLRKIFNERDFRQALSLAINRKEISEVFFLGLGTPRQESPIDESAHRYPPLADQYVEFDPAKANSLLDGLGLKRGPDGVRLRPDGKPLFITLESQALGAGTDALQLCAEYWTAVGVKTVYKLENSPLFYKRKSALVVDASAFPGTEALHPALDPRWYFPYSEESNHMIGYAHWYMSNGAVGDEPPPEVKRCVDLYNQTISTVDEKEQARLFRELLEINRENFWTIGTVGDLPDLCLVNSNVFNIPRYAVCGFMFRHPGNIKPECMAIGKGRPVAPN